MNKLIEAMVRSDVPSQELQPDMGRVAQTLEQIHQRFVDERTKGWTNPQTQQVNPPISREEAERRWQEVEPKFRETILRWRNDPDTSRRLGTGDKPGMVPGSSDYYDPEQFSNTPGVGLQPREFAPPEENWGEYENEWSTTPGQRRVAQAALDEPSLRRGESKASGIVRKLIGG